MTVDAERMRANLELTHGALFSQRVLLALVAAGMTRDDAYRIVQELAQRAWDDARPRCASCSRKTTAPPVWTSMRSSTTSTTSATPRRSSGGSTGYRPTRDRARRPASRCRGKVREMYDLDDRLLMVASDRISTYDVVHPTPIPDKGKVLTGLSVFWFAAHARHRLQPPDLRDRRCTR